MTETRQNGPTHLFTVRLWIERHTGKPSAIRGRVEHVLNRTVRYVNSLDALVVYLAAEMARREEDGEM
jgi:hypothetical protein